MARARKHPAAKPAVRYRLLREKITAYGVPHGDVAQAANMSPVTFSIKLGGRSPWGQDEMYAIMDFLHIDHALMDIYFPLDGLEISDRREDALDAYLKEQKKAVVSASSLATLTTLVKEMALEAR